LVGEGRHSACQIAYMKFLCTIPSFWDQVEESDRAQCHRIEIGGVAIAV
jgi:hypothetical protein